jgi:hypothetical protein
MVRAQQIVVVKVAAAEVRFQDDVIFVFPFARSAGYCCKVTPKPLRQIDLYHPVEKRSACR